VDLAETLATFGTSCGIDGLEKDAADLARYDEIITATKPTFLIECGTRGGASAQWFADRVPAVLTIDKKPGQYHARPGLIQLAGHSTNAAIVAAATQLARGRRVMVSLDSDHSRTHVKAEIALYSGLVSPGCYLVIEDGIYHWVQGHVYNGDPLEAISAMMPGRRGFVRDLDIEGRYPVTGAVAGWWRREG
jgi:cephalosporin hydroxylase